MLPDLTNLIGEAVGVNPLILLAAVVGILFGLVVIIVNVKLILDIAPYAYPNAKVRSMQSMLIGRKRLEELVELELLNIPGALEKTEYIETSKAISEEADIPTIEATLNQNLMETYTKIAGFLPGDAKKFFERYLKRFEVEAIKIVLTGVYAGLSQEDIENALAEPYRKELTDVAASSNISEAVSKLESSEFGRVLSESLPDFEAQGTLLPLEDALDKKFYQELMEVLLTRPSPDSDVIKKLLGAEIDITNIKIVLRGARYGADVSDYLLPYGYEISTPRLIEIGSSRDVERIVSDLEGTPYYQPLYNALEEYMADKDKSLSPFEKTLNTYYLSLGQTIATRQPFGLGPILGYIVSKGVEVRNLIAILTLKIEGLSPEEINRVVI